MSGPVPPEQQEPLAEALKTSLLDVLETMAWSAVKLSREEQHSNFMVRGEACGVMRVHGAVTGLIGLATSQYTGKELVSRIVGLSTDMLQPEDITDGLAELANLIGGGMKAKAGISGIHLDPPMAMVGQGILAEWKTEAMTRVITFEVGRDQLRLYANF
ncbi:MAG: chemotaxis protein CheX [Magnetococcales bacterium]|nr:chemotaxis protein CheX [Magnetococcales bacterium]